MRPIFLIMLYSLKEELSKLLHFLFISYFITALSLLASLLPVCLYLFLCQSSSDEALLLPRKLICRRRSLLSMWRLETLSLIIYEPD